MFVSADIEPNRRGPFDDFWYRPIGAISSAGMRVSPQTALAVTTLFACALVLGQDVAQVPLHLYRRLERGKERAVDHPLYKLLHRKPNRWQTSFQWRQMMQWHVVLRYNAYSRILFDRRGRPVELIPLHPDRVTVERIQTADGIPNFRYRFKPEKGEDIVLTRYEVLHIRGLTSDGIEGFSPLEAQNDSVGEAMAAQAYGARRLKNDARPGGVLEWSGHFSDDEERKKFRSSWQESQSALNAGKTAVLERGMTWKDLNVKNTDLQYIELRRLKREDMAAMFRMSQHKVGILDRATFANIEQQSIEHLQDTLMPWFVNWEQELSGQLLTEEEQDSLFFEHLAAGLLRGDAKARAHYIAQRFGTGSLSPNDIREIENENPIPGGDRYFVQVNMVPLDKVDEAIANRTTAPAGGGSGGSGGDNLDGEMGGQASAREAQLEQAAAERTVRKEVSALRRIAASGSHDEQAAAGTQFYLEHQAFVAEVLVLDSGAASDYCAKRAQAFETAARAGQITGYLAQLEAQGVTELMAELRV